MISFTVPGQPVGKARARTVVQGGKTHSFTPAKTARYEAFVAGVYKSLYPGAKPATGAVQVAIRAIYGVPKSWPAEKKRLALAELIPVQVKPDLDNVVKCICDALNGIAWEDDKQITWLQARKSYGAEPRVEVEIWMMEDRDGGK